MAVIDFDHNATTALCPAAAEALSPWASAGGFYGNPSSLHTLGQATRAALEAARRQAATAFGAADPGEIIFTSGGTEANNFALTGAAFAHRDRGRHLVTSAVEHHAVLNALHALADHHGFEVTEVPVNARGQVNPEDVRRALRTDTILVSIMAANNETGALQPIVDIGRLCRERNILFHSDAVQWAGKKPLDFRTWPVDLASLAAHKIYGPQGIGALYVRRGVKLLPLIHGGAQEKGRRGGTENVSGAVGFGAAAAWATENLVQEEARVERLRDRLEQGLLKGISHARVNGPLQDRLGNTCHLTIEGVEGESLVFAMDQAAFSLKQPERSSLCASTGSACASGLIEPSHVLLAMGFSRAECHASLRFSLGRNNSEREVDEALEIIPALVDKLRRLSPVWREKSL